MNINDLSKITQENLQLLIDGKLERVQAKEIFNGIGKVMLVENSRLKYHFQMGIKENIPFFDTDQENKK